MAEDQAEHKHFERNLQVLRDNLPLPHLDALNRALHPQQLRAAVRPPAAPKVAPDKPALRTAANAPRGQNSQRAPLLLHDRTSLQAGPLSERFRGGTPRALQGLLSSVCGLSDRAVRNPRFPAEN